MPSYSTSEFKSGLKLLINNEPYSIVENEFVKPGKGQAFSRVKLKNLKTGRVIDKTFKSGEKCEAADIFETELQFLYADASFCHFMNPKDFEQYSCNIELLSDTKQWLLEQQHYHITFWNEQIFCVEPPNQISLKVTQADPNVKGDTATGGTKNATLETGAIVRVPLFIETGEVIKIDTRTKEYISRVKA